jgi:hypothetical protein
VVQNASRPSTERRVRRVSVANPAPAASASDTPANSCPPAETPSGDQVSSTSPATAAVIDTSVVVLGRRRRRTAVASATNTGTLPMVIIVAMLTEVSETAPK